MSSTKAADILAEDLLERIEESLNELKILLRRPETRAISVQTVADGPSRIATTTCEKTPLSMSTLERKWIENANHVKEGWNKFVRSQTGPIREVRKIDLKRRNAVRACIEHGLKLEELPALFKEISNSDWLRGLVGNKQWIISFDWLFNKDNNWMRVLEGKYRNKQVKAPSSNTVIKGF